MNKPTHRLVTEKAIGILGQNFPKLSFINGISLTLASEMIQYRNSDTDVLKDLEFVDVNGHKGTGRDNPHKNDGAKAVDDTPRYVEKRFGQNRELTSFGHFIDIGKGPGLFDDYDGYSYEYGSGRKDQFEIQTTGITDINLDYVDRLVKWWYNDEYVHAPGQEYYQNCSPSVWRYSFPDGLKKYPNKYSELLRRFPLAEYKAKKGKGIPYSVMMPVDNLGRYWYETFMLSGNLGDLGPVLHAVQDATIPQHAAGYLGNLHQHYENWLESSLNNTVFDGLEQEILKLFNKWNKPGMPAPEQLAYPESLSETPNPNWRIDMLITWCALHAYHYYKNVYQAAYEKKLQAIPVHLQLNIAMEPKDFNHPHDERMKLIYIAHAMSMLVLVKAKAEFEASQPPEDRKIAEINVAYRTAQVKDADTKDRIAFYLYYDLFGGSIELPCDALFSAKKEKGETRKHNFNVRNFNLDAEKLRVGVGLLGQDKWMPDLFDISYWTVEGKRYIYTWQNVWNTWFDHYFWYPIQKSPPPRTQVCNIDLEYKTSTKIHADTGAGLELVVQAGEKTFEMDFPAVALEKNSTHFARFDVRDRWIFLEDLHMAINNKSEDGWHPKTIRVIIWDMFGKAPLIDVTRNWPNHTWFERSLKSKPKRWIW